MQFYINQMPITTVSAVAVNLFQQPGALRRIGWHSVLKTQSSRLTMLGSTKDKYRYLRTSAK